MDLPRVNQSPLMSLKHGHVHAKHAAALRATEPGCVPHHIDNVDPQRRLMRVDARSQMVERWRSMLIHRLVLSGQVSRQGSDCDSMRHSAGTAGNAATLVLTTASSVASPRRSFRQATLWPALRLWRRRPIAASARSRAARVCKSIPPAVFSPPVPGSDRADSFSDAQ